MYTLCKLHIHARDTRIKHTKLNYDENLNCKENQLKYLVFKNQIRI